MDNNSVNIRAHKGPCRPYSEEEIELVRSTYPEHGLKGCMKLFPERSIHSVRGLVERLRLKRNGRSKWGRINTTEHIDKAIITVYRSGKWGSVKKLADDIDRPYAWVRQRALTLGVRSVAKWDRFWTEEEDALLSDLAGRHILTIKRKFNKAGFKRSESAIQERLYILGRETSDPDMFTATDVSRILGVDLMHVLRWIKTGMLRSSRARHMVISSVAANRGPGKHWITYRELRRFMIACPLEWHCRRVRDSVWLVSLLAGRVGVKEERGSDNRGVIEDDEDEAA